MTRRATHDLTDEDLELRAAAFAVILGIGALALLATAVVVGMILA